MATADLGHELTEQELAKLERQIAAVYKEAQEELQQTVTEYFAQFEERDKKMKALIGTIQNGKEWTEADYKQWRLNQIGRGERFEALRDEMAKRYTDANAVALSYVNDAMPGIYSLNRNYAAYTIDKSTGGALTMPGGSLDASWTLFDESTVQRLISEQPDLMPNYPAKKALERGIDLAYGKKQITSSVTSAILQGKSIKGIADDLQSRISGMERASAIRTARTAVTGAQNAGRIDSYKAAEKMGIAVKKEWLATLDNRTRHAHAILDGQKRDTDDPFEVDGYKIRFPGDPQAKGYLVYNCRCTLIAALDDVDTSDAQRRARDQETGESVLISDMSYSEWAGWKKKETVASDTVRDIIKEKPKIQFRQFDTGDAVNEFFYYDGEQKGLLAKKKSQYSNWLKGLSEDERSWILDYTAGGYGDINDYLRQRGSWDAINAEKVKEAVKNMDSAISRYVLKDNIVVQRGVMEDALDGLIAQYGDDSAGLIGKVFHDDGYLSTTALLGNPVATTKPVLFEISVPAGTGRGAYVNELSGFKDAEYEFLLKRGANYTITDIVENNETGQLIVKMVMNDE